jgi:glycosyltransferase involved in cell wall biosynthesis
MKVCMVAYSFYERDNRVRRYAEALVKRGDRVDAVALRQGDQPQKEVINGVRVFRIQHRAVTEKSKCTYLAKLLLFLFRSMLFLTWQQIRERYDLIHVHSVPDFEVFAAVFPKLTGSKIILDVHDIVPEFYCSKFQIPQTSLAFKLLVGIERLSTAFCNHVIVANHIWEKRLRERSVAEYKCTAILNVPDTSIFRRRGRIRADGKFIMLYPGTLNYHQGLDIAIRAFALIKDAAPQAEFHLYGRGEQAEFLRSLVRELGLQGRVFLNDTVPFNEIASIMENADLGVVPKRKNNFGNEAFSSKTLEFMSLGVPLIVPDTAVDQYYFNDSVVKFFRAEDERSLADAMLLLIKDQELRQQLIKRSEEFVARYTWDQSKVRYLNLVDSLVHTQSGHGPLTS